MEKLETGIVEQVKPFTLEWWIHKNNVCMIMAFEGKFDRWQDRTRYWEMAMFIQNRIMNKYGEQNT